MSFTASVSGHLPTHDDAATVDSVKDAFENFIRALQAIDADPTGQISGHEDGEPFTFKAADVQPLEYDESDAPVPDTSDDTEVTK